VFQVSNHTHFYHLTIHILDCSVKVLL